MYICIQFRYLLFGISLVTDKSDGNSTRFPKIEVIERSSRY